MGNSPFPLLDRVLATFALPLPSFTAEALTTWLGLVQTWRTKINLTAASTHDELVDLMVADAIVLAAHIPTAKRVVDVGAGAGAPGLPLAIMRPDLTVTLIEPRQKRIAFLNTVLGTWIQQGLSPTNLRIECSRGEQLVAQKRSFEVAISRATLSPQEWLSLGATLTAGEPTSNQEVWVFLANQPIPIHAGWTVESDLVYHWPLTGVQRRAVRYRKE